MQFVTGIPDTVKQSGFSNADIKCIHEQTEKYREMREHQEHEGVPDVLRREIIEIATEAFQTGMVLGILEARRPELFILAEDIQR
jgi:hypothetical protein